MWSRLSARFARCSTTFASRPTGASWWFRDARRGLAPQPPNKPRRTHEPEPSRRNHRISSRATGSRTKGSGRHRNPTPTATTTLVDSDQPTGQIRWFRDARWRSLLNHRAAWCGLDCPARCSTTGGQQWAARLVALWSRMDVLGEGGARLRPMRAAEAFRQQGEACAASGVADVRRAALRPRPRHRPSRADVAGAARARGRPGAVGAGPATARQRAPAGAGTQGGWAGGVLPERGRSLERAARCACVHRPPRAGPRGGQGVARPTAADQRGRAGDRADGRAAAPAGAAARAGAALRDRLLGGAEPAGRPVQLHRHDRQPLRRRSVAGPPATGLARRPPHALARPRVRGDGRLRPQPHRSEYDGGTTRPDGVRLARPAQPARAAAGCPGAGPCLTAGRTTTRCCRLPRAGRPPGRGDDRPVAQRDVAVPPHRGAGARSRADRGTR